MSREALYVIKIGGNIVDNPEALADFLHDFAALPGYKILVHGGGKIATRLAQDIGVQVKMVEGRRITDEAMLDVVTMIYAGLSNKKIVAALQGKQCNAIGLSGADANAICCAKRPVKEIDYGYVGDVLQDSVNTDFIKSMLESDYTPVFSAITHDGQGQLLNTNADTIASALAVALSRDFEVSLVYCFEKRGVLRDVNDNESLIQEVNSEDFNLLKAEGIVADGMVPKLKNAFDAIDAGVTDVFIGMASELPGVKDKHFGTRMVK